MTEKWMKGPYEVAKRGTYPADEGFKVMAPEQVNSQGKSYRLYVAQFVKSEAEANLFAAAPDLYEALNALLGGDEKMRPMIGGNPNYVDAFTANLTKAYAALAKARGEGERNSSTPNGRTR